jgi:hypothetical protein
MGVLCAQKGVETLRPGTYKKTLSIKPGATTSMLSLMAQPLKLELQV